MRDMHTVSEVILFDSTSPAFTTWKVTVCWFWQLFLSHLHQTMANQISDTSPMIPVGQQIIIFMINFKIKRLLIHKKPIKVQSNVFWSDNNSLETEDIQRKAARPNIWEAATRVFCSIILFFGWWTGWPIILSSDNLLTDTFYCDRGGSENYFNCANEKEPRTLMSFKRCIRRCFLAILSWLESTGSAGKGL